MAGGGHGGVGRGNLSNDEVVVHPHLSALLERLPQGDRDAAVGVRLGSQVVVTMEGKTESVWGERKRA